MNLQSLQRLPDAIESPQAVRIASYLRAMEIQAKISGSLVVYGSAAVSLLTADETSEYGFTDDIDVGKASESVRTKSPILSDVVDPPLHLQFYGVEQWLIHPDWEESLIGFSDLLGLTNLKVSTLHPLDLVITKLERAGDQDIEDGIRLRSRFLLDPICASERVREACKFHPVSSRMLAQVSYAFESIFEAEIELRS